MSKDLMELVGGCPVDLTPSEPRLLRYLEKKGEKIVSEYRDLGFVKATEERHQKNLRISKRQKIFEFEYRVITTEAIRKFLQRKVKLYDKKHKPKPKKKDTPDVCADKTAEFPDLAFTQLEETLEQAREALRRSVMDSGPFMGMVANMRSAQEQIRTDRDRWIIEHEERRRRDMVLASHQRQIIAYDPIPFHAPWSNPSGTCSIYEKTCDYDKVDLETIGRFEWKEERVEDYDGLPPIAVLETFKEHKARGAFDYFTIASVNDIPDPLLLGRIDGDEDNRWFIAQWSNDVCLDDVI